MKLTPKQMEYLPAIQWLIDNSMDMSTRASGRSTVLGYAFLLEAKKNLGNWIEVWDHYRHPMTSRRLLDTISKIYQTEEFEKKYKIVISILKNSIKLEEKENAH